MNKYKLVFTFFLTAFLVVLFSENSFSQRRSVLKNRQEIDQQSFHWGYILGLSRFNFTVSPDEVEGTNETGENYLLVKPSTGFSAGLLADIRINKRFNVRIEPTLHFTSKELIFRNLNGASDSIRDLSNNYLDIPVLLKMNSNRFNNVRPYIAAGFGFMRNLGSEENTEEDNSQGVFRMKANNFNYQMEFGVEIYLKYFKLTPAIKGIFVFNDEVVPDNDGTTGWTSTINYLRTRAFVFSLKFE